MDIIKNITDTLNQQQKIIWETIERNRTKKNKCIIKGMIRWKISYRSNKAFKISKYILNGWEIKKIVLAKQKNSSNETKMNNCK